MLRNVFRPTLKLVRHRTIANLSDYAHPSSKTTILLRKLPLAMTGTQLAATFKDLPTRKVEIEPGCSFHLLNDCEADLTKEFLAKQYNIETSGSRATLPVLSLHNVPANVPFSSIQSAFAGFRPLYVNLEGGRSIKIKVNGSEDASKAIGLIKKSVLVGEAVVAHSQRTGVDEYVITVTNLESDDLKLLGDKLIATLKDSGVVNCSLSNVHLGRNSVALRYNYKTAVTEQEIAAVIKKLKLPIVVSKPISVEKPTVVLRNIAHVDDVQFEKELAEFADHIDSVLPIGASSAVRPHTTNVYFNDEDAAIRCVNRLDKLLVQNKPISATFRAQSEPAICVKNLSSHTTAAQFEALVGGLKFSHWEFLEDDLLPEDNVKEAMVYFAKVSDAQTAISKLHNRAHDNRSLKAELRAIYDKVFKLTHIAEGTPVEAADADKIVYHLSEEPKHVGYHTNVRADIGFAKTSQAENAMHEYTTGKVVLRSGSFAEFGTHGSAKAPYADTNEGNTIVPRDLASQTGGSVLKTTIGSKLTNVVQMHGLDTETSLASVINKLKKNPVLQDINFLQTNRSGLIKFKRAEHAKEYKILIPKQFHPERYQPLEQVGDSAYDEVMMTYELNSDGYNKSTHRNSQETFHRLRWQSIMGNGLEMDPATRYQIAKNHFERELRMAWEENKFENLFDASIDNLTNKALQEAQDLFFGEGFCKSMPEADRIKRLFDIYVQKEDQIHMSRDFENIEAILGPADDSDPLNWTTFDVATREQAEQILGAMEEAQEVAMNSVGRRLSGGKKVSKEALEALRLMGGDVVADQKDAKDDDSDDSDDELLKAAQQAELAKIKAETDEMKAVDPEKEQAEAFSRSMDWFKEEDEESEDNMTHSDTDDDEMQFRKPTVTDESGTAASIFQNKYGELVDKFGQAWSAAVIDEGAVQKTMPGGRVISFRALVVIGNGRGSGAYGIGKASEPDLAVAAACRNARRRLLHIDLYENCALAQDLYGKHNACHAYINATHPSSDLVAGSVAGGILSLFGITSASCKIIGNRNPYSQVYAMFNALKLHTNLDEQAKSRGQRYLTLKWAKDHRL